MCSAESGDSRGEVRALLDVAIEATRFEGEAIWRAEEFFAGIVSTILVASVGIWGFAPASLSVQARGLGAGMVALVAAVLAFVGQYVVAIESFHLIRNRLARDRLTEVLAADFSSTHNLVERARHLLRLGLLWEDVVPPRLCVDDLKELGGTVFGHQGVRMAFRIVLGIFALLGLIGTVTFCLLAFSLYPLSRWGLGAGAAALLVFVVMEYLVFRAPQVLREAWDWCRDGS